MTNGLIETDTAAARSGPGTARGDALAPWLRSMLRMRSWRQRDLAEKMEVDPSMVSKWVRGERRPDPPHCRSIAEALHVPLNEVLKLAGHVPQAEDLEAVHPIRARLHELVDAVDPEILAHHLALLERMHELTESGAADGR